MKPLLSIICPSLEHRPFVDQATLVRARGTLVEFLRLSDNDWRSTGRKTVDLIRMARGKFVMGMGDDDILHPSFFDLVLPHLRGPKNQMVGFNIRVLRDQATPDLICKVHPKFGPFETAPPGSDIAVERWDGDVQLRPYAMVNPVRRDLYDNLVETDVINKSWCEDNHLMTHIIPQLKVERCHYIDKALYYAFPLITNPDRKEWSTRYDD